MRTITPVESFVLAVIVGIVVFLLLATQGCQTQTKPYSAARPMPVTRAMAPAEQPMVFKLVHCPSTSEYITLQFADAPGGSWSNGLSVVAPFGTCVELGDSNPNATSGFYRVCEHSPATNAVVRTHFFGGVAGLSFCRTLSSVTESGRYYHVKELW